MIRNFYLELYYKRYSIALFVKIFIAELKLVYQCFFINLFNLYSVNEIWKSHEFTCLFDCKVLGVYAENTLLTYFGILMLFEKLRCISMPSWKQKWIFMPETLTPGVVYNHKFLILTWRTFCESALLLVLLM